MLKNYLVTALKVFQRRKYFTFISLFAISITLMVLMVVVTFLDSMFGPNPPETRQDRILGVFSIHLSNSARTATWDGVPGYKFLDRYVREIPNVEKMSIIGGGSAPLPYYHNGEKVSSYFKATDGAFWRIMDFTFLEGSPYTEDDIRNSNRVAVINESTRRKLFGKGPALGQQINFRKNNYRIVGVVRDVLYLKQISFADVWVSLPIPLQPDAQTEVYGLLLARSAADIPGIKADYQSRLKNIALPVQGVGGDNSGIGGTFWSFWRIIESRPETFFELKTRGLASGDFDFNWNDQFTKSGGFDINTHANPSDSPYPEASRPKRSIVIIISALLLFMFLPTINLVNVNISRIMERAGEIGVRKAFGASSWTLVGQFVTENILLTLIGGAFAFALTHLVLHGITLSGLVPNSDFQFNYRIFLYGLVLAVFFGLISGVYPAWRMSRLHPVVALKGSIEGGGR
jgi:putative ABC transport system permease protein